MKELTILLIGNGGREHALAWKLSQSSKVQSIFVVPGNGGTATVSKVTNISHVKANDFQALMAFAKESKVNFIVPGPEAPLVEGIEDACREANIPCFGPTKKAAQMEGSKTFAKDFMVRHQIPTAEFRNFSDFEAARAYIDSVSHDIVIKASGIAAGKGVIIPASKEEAHQALTSIMLKKEFGAAGNEVVIEEFLQGEELSILSFSDGFTIRSLPAAQDHKQIFDGDKGPMTGGMGCYAPTRVATPELTDEIHRTILQPTIDGMRREGMPFVGLLFTGFMITNSGPKVLEYNVRFGDPETETLLPLLSQETDLARVMWACTTGWLDEVELKIEPKFSATVIASAGGYPGVYARGDEIRLSRTPPDIFIFHAGTDKSSGTLRTHGGRILAATATGRTLEEALKRAYAGMDTVKFNGMHFRTDIGHRALSLPSSALLNNDETLSIASAQSPSDSLVPLTYASAGVSITAGNSLVNLIKPLVRSTARPGADASIGGFGGVIDLSTSPTGAGYTSAPLLVAAIDGVGTKLNIAHEMGKHDTVGIDCVAMNVNDLVVQGAEVLFFLDCYTCEKLDVNVAAEFVRGVAKGCIDAGCALVGGETAEMPGLFGGEDGGKYDAVGAAVGAVEHGRRLLPDKTGMGVGDVVLGLASNGCHSNAFSLIRKIVKLAGLGVRDLAPWDSSTTVGESLLTPTRIYVRPLLKAVAQDLLKGMSHITGGGLLENIPRMLPKHLAAEIDVSTWPMPPVFRWLKTQGRVEDLEYARTFNTGLGMVLVVADVDAAKAILCLEDAGETVFEIGKLTGRDGAGCVLKGLEAWR
ncbi:hypothetical protein MMC19_000562 [Ptychographa xylographoides]|nr:hypothetical protein [Ptychographa xylographoides]